MLALLVATSGAGLVRAYRVITRGLISLRRALGADWVCPQHAEVAPQQVVVGDGDYVVPVEVGPPIVAGVCGHPAERVPQDAEVADGDNVIVIAVPCPHQAHLGGADCTSRQGQGAGVSQPPRYARRWRAVPACNVIGTLHPP